VAKKDTTYP